MREAAEMRMRQTANRMLIDYDISDNDNREELQLYLIEILNAKRVLDSCYVCRNTSSPTDVVNELKDFVDILSEDDGIVVNDLDSSLYDAYPATRKRILRTI